MRSFPFEKDLIDKRVVEWVADHPGDAHCRAVIDAHERAQRTELKEDVDSYEKSLRILWVVRPWDG